MLGHQHRSKDLARLDEMMHVGALELDTGGTRAVTLDRVAILREARVAQVQWTTGCERLAGAARAGRKHAVEHVDPAHDRLDDVVRLADAHEVARTLGGQHVDGVVEAAEHRFLSLSNGKATDRITVESNVEEAIG